MPANGAVLARLSAVARVAASLDARAALADARRALADLQAPAALTTAAGQALAAITAERRAAEREQRARHLRSLPDLATAEFDLKGNAR